MGTFNFIKRAFHSYCHITVNAQREMKSSHIAVSLMVHLHALLSSRYIQGGQNDGLLCTCCEHFMGDIIM